MTGRLFLLLWRLVGLLALPVLLLHPRARRHILSVPRPEPGWTWLHGASAGEHRAAVAIEAALPGRVWRTSSSWRTPVAGAFPAPLDLPFVFSRWLDAARPGRLILVEAALWPGWLAACRLRGIPVVVVNARPGRGTDRWKKLGWLWRWLMDGVTVIPQSQTGDLKLSATPPPAPFSLPRPAIIAASTRPGDEARMLTAWSALPLPRPMLVIAPRHLKRVGEVVGMMAASGHAWSRRSVDMDLTRRVLLLDTVGELAGLLREADAAFIGGTFDADIGGHSPAEAFAAGLPVVRGPHAWASPAAWEAGVVIEAGDDLAGALSEALHRGRQPPAAQDGARLAVASLPASRTPPERPTRPSLRPLRPLWVCIGGRLPAYADEPESVGVPVVSVGSLVAGGAGKTPAVAWLAERLPGAWVVARGYRRGGDDDGVRSEGDLGDELEMLRRRGIPVISAPDRVAGAQEAVRQGARLILLDDGFQHRRLHRDLDIVCIDGRYPDSGGLIPMGSRREPWSALSRASFVWHSHADHPLPRAISQPTVSARYRPVGWLRRGVVLPLSAFTGPCTVVTGIARPEGFVCALLSAGLTVASLKALPDHAPLGTLPPGAVVTEKDAARLPPDADVWALKMELEVTGAEPLLAAIAALEET
ncbi:MAG: tetraacyldisaccharide 4'-kinase [Myxococcota bacterium]